MGERTSEVYRFFAEVKRIDWEASQWEDEEDRDIEILADE